MTQTCQCPQKPYYSPGSMASGSNAEASAHRAWEDEHGRHTNAPSARLAYVHINRDQLDVYRDDLRQHLERNGEDALLQIAPHHLKALLDAADVSLSASYTAALQQSPLTKALAALRAVSMDEGSAPESVLQAICAARDFLREAGAKNT